MTTPADDRGRIESDIWFELRLVRLRIARHLRDIGEAELAADAEGMTCEEDVRYIQRQIEEEGLECPEAVKALQELSQTITKVQEGEVA